MSSTAGWFPHPDGQRGNGDGELWAEGLAAGVSPVAAPPPVLAVAPQPTSVQLAGHGPPPDTPLPWAWACALLFCPPLGIPAVVYASRVRRKWAAGDLLGARQDSHQAQNFVTLSVVFGVALWFFLLM